MNTDLQNMNLTVLMGGDSAEREISMKSGTAVADALESAGARVSRVDTAAKGCTAIYLWKPSSLICFMVLAVKMVRFRGCSSPWGFTIQDRVCSAVHCAWTKQNQAHLATPGPAHA